MHSPSPYFIRPGFNDSSNGQPFTPAELLSPEQPTLREYWRVITKRWWIVIAPVILALTATALIVSFMAPTYTAHSTILIERDPPQVLNIQQLASEQADEQADGNFYGTQYKILESRSLAARVIHDLDLNQELGFSTSGPGLLSRAKELLLASAKARTRSDGTTPHQKDPPSAPYLSAMETDAQSREIDAYLDHLDIRPEPATRLVVVSFTSPDPTLSARIVNAHVQAYIVRGTELRSQMSHSAEKFLEQKLAELKTRVEKSELALNTYRSHRGIVADSPDDKNNVEMDRLVELNKALTETETERITLDTQVHLLDAQDYNSLPAVVEEPLIQNLKQELAGVEADYASLASEYKPDYPPLADLAAKRQELQTRLRLEMRRIASGIEWKYQAALSRERKLRQEIDREQKRALALNDSSAQDAILARDVDTNRELYRNVLARMNELGMAAGISASNVSVVDYAEPPTEPSSPKKLLSLTFSALFGLVIGVIGAFTVDRLDDSLKGPQEVEHSLGIPALGVVPDFRALNRTGHILRYLPRRASDQAQLPATVLADNLAVLDSFSSASEAYRAIRIGILLSQAEIPPKVILVTSGCAREGKTVTAINLAAVFAQMGENVLLIDADLRRPRCREVLKVPERAGLTEILTGRATPEELVQPTIIAGLSCLTAGSLPPNPAALLGSKRMAEVLALVRESYGCIVIDSSPVISVADSLVLAGLADGVLLVANPDTTKQDMRFVCSRLMQTRVKVLGAVLNRFSPTGHYYRHYYYRDYHSEEPAGSEQEAQMS